MRSLNTLSLHHDCRGISGRVISAIAASLVLSSIALSGCAQTKTNYDDRTFFRDEQGLETHGRKTWFDHLVELDPWTDGNRLRRAVNGYLASREFLVANVIQVDAILKEYGIDSEQKLEQVPPQMLGKWLGVDAVVYGDVRHYDAYYAFCYRHGRLVLM